jgi:hypothetical protein
MSGGATWRYLRTALLLVGIHLLISIPFLFLGPMLTIPGSSHGMWIGWIWTVLEMPAILVAGPVLLYLKRVGTGTWSPQDEYTAFVALASVCWFCYGLALQFIVGVFRRLRVKRAKMIEEG